MLWCTGVALKMTALSIPSLLHCGHVPSCLFIPWKWGMGIFFFQCVVYLNYKIVISHCVIFTTDFVSVDIPQHKYNEKILAVIFFLNLFFSFCLWIADNIQENFSRTFRQPLPEVCKVFWDLQDEHSKMKVRWLTVDVYYLETIHRVSLETRIKSLFPADGNWGLTKHFHSILPPSAALFLLLLDLLFSECWWVAYFQCKFHSHSPKSALEVKLLAHVASLFFSCMRGVLQSLIETNRYLSHLHLLEMPTWYWVCVLRLVQKYWWQIGFKLTATGLLWHQRIAYGSELHPLRSRFYFITQNASVHPC